VAEAAAATLGAGELVFSYRLDEWIPLDRVVSQNLERWVVSVCVAPGIPGDRRSEIGSANVIIITLAAGEDVRDFTDPVTGTWIDHDSGADEKPPTHLLVLDRVWLHADYRGDGLGPIIAAAVIERLGRGCSLVACYPAPFEGRCEPDDRAGSVEALGRIWAKAGFQPWSDGVWMLDPQQEGGRGALARLVAERSDSIPD
jgi:hypothetical protein